MVKTALQKWKSTAAALLLLLLVNIGAAFWYTRADFTQDRRYTPDQKTKTLLSRNRQPLTITVFLQGNLPPAFKRLKQAAADLLNDDQAGSKASLKVRFTDPLEGLDAEARDTVLQHLYDMGIEPLNLHIKNESGFSEQLVFPAAIVQCGSRQVPVRLLQTAGAGAGYEESINNAIQNLEYAFTSAIRKATTGENPRIGFTEGHGEPSDDYLRDAMKSLSDSYEVGRVNLSMISRDGLDKLKVLFITRPSREFSEAEKYKLNYFVMNGGRIVWSLDQVSADLDSLKGSGEQLAFNNKLNLDDQLFTYGARINYNLVADLNCAEIPLAMGGGGSQQDIQFAPWVFYPVLVPDASVSLVRNIDGIRTEFLSTVDTIAVKGVKKSIILHTSAYNRVLSTPQLLSLQLAAQTPDQRQYYSSPRAAAVLLEGSFPSVFAGRGIPAGLTGNYTVPERSKPTKMVVIGDGNIFLNQLSGKDGSAFPLGFDRYTQRSFGNKALLLNLADALATDDNLIGLRNKTVKIRLLDKQRLKNEKTKWQLINVALPLVLLFGFAIFQYYYRKYKYAR